MTMMVLWMAALVVQAAGPIEVITVDDAAVVLHTPEFPDIPVTEFEIVELWPPGTEPEPPAPPTPLPMRMSSCRRQARFAKLSPKPRVQTTSAAAYCCGDM